MLIAKKQMAFFKSVFERYYSFQNSADAHEQKMFRVLDKIIDAYKADTEKSKFIQMCLISKKTWKGVHKILHIERRTYFMWREEILRDAVIYAAVNGLIELDIERL